ncbi:MAG: beta-Ala-His dipeptidase [Eubacterium sp.]|nr:beta-Ala-His dipeptidase [Eubacterium sp.]
MRKNSILEDLEPKEVFQYFQEICNIPHGSGNTEAIAAYCMDFARKNGHKSYQDSRGNVIVYVKASRGYEHCEPVALQGHLDMVCDKTADCKKDMEKEGIHIVTEGNYIMADQTTLGADDGIGIAYLLAVASMNVPHPPLELIFTVDEEIGMLGAQELDLSGLQARRLINLDSEEEGILTVSCAGGVRAEIRIPFRKDKEEKKFIQIVVRGLPGGHSGVEMHKNIPNAIKLLAELLHSMEGVPFSLCNFQGGARDNSIPKQASAVIGVEENQWELTLECLEKATEKIKEKNSRYTRLCIEIEPTESGIGPFLCREDSKRILSFIRHAPDGVFKMSAEMKGMVESSSNLGVCRTEESEVIIKYLIRSNVTEGKDEICRELSRCAGKYGAAVKYYADYPAWEWKKNFPLLDVMIQSYEEEYGEKPVISGIHAGLECGILAGRAPGVDMVSMGPTLLHVHTTEEKMDIASVQRTWQYLLRILHNLKERRNEK